LFERWLGATSAMLRERITGSVAGLVRSAL